MKDYQSKDVCKYPAQGPLRIPGGYNNDVLTIWHGLSQKYLQVTGICRHVWNQCMLPERSTLQVVPEAV